MANIPAKRNIPGVYQLLNDQSQTMSPIAALYVAALLSSRIGEANKIIELGDETALVAAFGAPTDTNFDEWFNIQRTWNYRVGGIGGIYKVVRPIGTGSINGALTVTSTQVVAASTPLLIPNREATTTATIVFDDGSDATDGIVKFFSAYPTDVVRKIALCSATDFVTAEIYNGVTFADNFEFGPEGTEVAIAVLDGSNNILEKRIVDLTPGKVDSQGFDNYIENVFNQKSNYIYAFKNNSATGVPFSFEATALVGGAYVAPTEADYVNALKLFENTESVDINYVNSHPMVHSEVISLCENRLDCTFRAGVPKNLIVGVDMSTALAALKTFASTTLPTNTTYGSMNAQAFLIFDSYNNKYRWVNCAGDMIGLRIKQNLSSQPWYSDAGLNYGQIQNVEKFAQYWDVAAIKTIIEARMNPIILKPNIGFVKWGQRNFFAKPSAMRDEGVMELIVYIWRTAKVYLQYKLYEFNDDFTRGAIASQMNRFLKNVQDGRGIRKTDAGADGFKVRCDSTNNPSDVINQNMLIVDIGFLPNRAIEEIYFRLTIAESEIQLELI